HGYGISDGYTDSEIRRWRSQREQSRSGIKRNATDQKCDEIINGSADEVNLCRTRIHVRRGDRREHAGGRSSHLMAEGGNGEDTRQEVRLLDGESGHTLVTRRIIRVTENVDTYVNTISVDAERREIRECIGVQIWGWFDQILLKVVKRKAARRGNSRAAADGEEDPVRR